MRIVIGGYAGAGGCMANCLEPLEPALWFDRVEIIARGDLGSIERSLRHAMHLLQLTPPPFRDIIRLSVDECVFEKLLEQGEFDTAARHLVAQPTALSLDEQQDGSVNAAIKCVILGRVIRGTGDSVAKAVLSAWTTCLLALRTQFGPDLNGLGEDLSLGLVQAGHHSS